VEEGLFVSSEPVEVLDQHLELPNHQVGVLKTGTSSDCSSNCSRSSYIGINPQYISLEYAAGGASRKRELSPQA
jgi:hypothetical protein